MRAEPPLREKIAALPADEIDGFEGQLARDGRLTPEAKNLLAMRRESVARPK